MANGWIAVTVSQGTPPSLQLSAGIFDLGWQVDTTADVPSYIVGAAGDGFRVPADFGIFPALLIEGSNNWETTSEAWATYISYEVPVPVSIDVRVIDDTVTLVRTSNPGTYYQVQWSGNLSPPAWIDAGLPVQATGPSTQWSESGFRGVGT